MTSVPLHPFVCVCHFYTYIRYVQSPNVSFYKNFVDVHRLKEKEKQAFTVKGSSFAFVTNLRSLLSLSMQKCALVGQGSKTLDRFHKCPYGFLGNTPRNSS